MRSSGCGASSPRQSRARKKTAASTTYAQRPTSPPGNSSKPLSLHPSHCSLIAFVPLTLSRPRASHNSRYPTVHFLLNHSAQRNTYLTGFCLFLSLVLTRTFYILLQQLTQQEELAALKKAVSHVPTLCALRLIITRTRPPPARAPKSQRPGMRPLSFAPKSPRTSAKVAISVSLLLASRECRDESVFESGALR